MDRREYNRQYYYKRDPVKLDEYRRRYKRKLKEKKYQAKKRLERGMKPRVKKTLADAQTYKQRYYYSHLEQHSKHMKEYYAKNKERLLDNLNFKYRTKKLKEFADNVLNLPEDNIVNNYGRR